MLRPKDYISSLMKLAQDRRGEFKEMKYIIEHRASIIYELSLAEMVGDFSDQLKSRSKGYASMEYTFIGYKESELIKLDIQINGELVEPLSTIVHKDKGCILVFVVEDEKLQLIVEKETKGVIYSLNGVVLELHMLRNVEEEDGGEK